MPAEGEPFELRVRERLIAKLRTVADELDALDDVSASNIAAVLDDDVSPGALDQVAGDRGAVRKLAAAYRDVADAIAGDAA